MRITQVTPGLISIPPNGWGAIEKIIWNYTLKLRELGHQVDIKYLNDVDINNTDIVHIHVANLAIIAKERGIPYIFSLHDHHAYHYGKDSVLYKENLEAIKGSIISFTHAEYLVDYFDSTDKLFYISHGVDTNFFKPIKNKIVTEHKLLCLANNGLAGNNTYDRKGFRYAIEAAKELNLPITIAGPENNENFFNHHSDLMTYEKLTLNLTNPDDSDIVQLFNDHSIFIHPSMLEAGHPNLTLLESMSCEVPIVGTYNGSHRIGGMLIADRTVDDIVSKVRSIIDNYDFYVNDCRSTKMDFDWLTITKRLETIYMSVLDIKKKYDSNLTKKLYYDVYNNTHKEPIKIINANPMFNIHFIKGPFVEIIDNENPDDEYLVQFIDNSTDKVLYSTTIKPNHWCRSSIQYYVPWRINIYKNNMLVHEHIMNFENKRVFVVINSSSLGDNIAWIPYVEEFRKKHNCSVICSTFKNFLFDKSYPEIEFVTPGSVVNNLYAQYNIGWDYDPYKEREIVNTIPLQKTSSNVLGLEFTEIKPNINFTPKQKPIVGKYITIAPNSTAGLKLWNYENGWEILVSELNKLGYTVINVSSEKNQIKGAAELNDKSLERTMNVIYHSELYIGLSSGLSWLSWALGKHVVMISNFTEKDHEFTSNCTRIINTEVCHGCWNDPMFKFDKGDWFWCPNHKGTDRQFECHKSITPEIVLNSVLELL